MALKLPDSAVPMGDFPVAKAVDIDFNDGENLQEKLDNGKLGGSGGGASTYTSLEALGLTAPVTVGEIFNAMPDKTMAVIACEGKEGNTDGGAVHVSDVPISYGVLTIKKNEKGRFSIEYQNSLQGSTCNVRRWIGTLKGLDGTGLVWKQLSAEPTFVALNDIGLTADATVEDVVNALKSGESFLAPVNIFTNYETIFPNRVPNDQWNKIHIIKGTSLANSHIRCFSQSGACEYLANVNMTNIVSWNDVSGTYTDVTESIVEKLGNEILKYPVGKYRINSTTTGDKFTDLPSDTETKCGLIEINGTAIGKSPFTDTWVYRMYKFECLTGTSSYIRRLNSGATVGQIETDTGWQRIKTSSTKKTLAFNSKTFKIDITKGNANWNGNMKFGYCVDESYGEIIISSLGKTDVLWDHSTGVRYVKSVTYTVDPDNKAHVTIGVELYETVYGVHQLETCSDFATINSFTGDAFTGTSVAKRGATRGRNNGVGILCDVADLGLTLPCTTVQIAQAMRNLTNGGARIPASGMIGIFDNGGNKITDVPTEYGLLQVNAYGYDRVMIRYDGMASSNHTGSWMGQIKASSGGTFNSVTWSRLDLETRVNELFQSVSDGKTLVANAITGKGVSTATNATFATMATNIGKISGGYKEETKSLIVTSGTTGTEALPFKFSANVIAVKQIVAPSDSCRIVTQTSKNMLTINGSQIVLYVAGTGTWKVTALIEK